MVEDSKGTKCVIHKHCVKKAGQNDLCSTSLSLCDAILLHAATPDYGVPSLCGRWPNLRNERATAAATQWPSNRVPTVVYAVQGVLGLASMNIGQGFGYDNHKRTPTCTHLLHRQYVWGIVDNPFDCSCMSDDLLIGVSELRFSHGCPVEDHGTTCAWKS